MSKRPRLGSPLESILISDSDDEYDLAPPVATKKRKRKPRSEAQRAAARQERARRKALTSQQRQAEDEAKEKERADRRRERERKQEARKAQREARAREREAKRRARADKLSKSDAREMSALYTPVARKQALLSHYAAEVLPKDRPVTGEDRMRAELHAYKRLDAAADHENGKLADMRKLFVEAMPATWSELAAGDGLYSDVWEREQFHRWYVGVVHATKEQTLEACGKVVPRTGTLYPVNAYVYDPTAPKGWGDISFPRMRRVGGTGGLFATISVLPLIHRPLLSRTTLPETLPFIATHHGCVFDVSAKITNHEVAVRQIRTLYKMGYLARHRPTGGPAPPSLHSAGKPVFALVMSFLVETAPKGVKYISTPSVADVSLSSSSSSSSTSQL